LSCVAVAVAVVVVVAVAVVFVLSFLYFTFLVVFSCLSCVVLAQAFLVVSSSLSSSHYVCLCVRPFGYTRRQEPIVKVELA
jgi:hypothetical protein